MEYQPAAQSVTMVMPSTHEDYKRNPKIKKTRSQLLGVLVVEMVRIISDQS